MPVRSTGRNSSSVASRRSSPASESAVMPYISSTRAVAVVRSRTMASSAWAVEMLRVVPSTEERSSSVNAR